MQRPISINRSINDSYSDDDMGMGALANTNKANSAPGTPLHQHSMSAPQAMQPPQMGFSAVPQYPMPPPPQASEPQNVNINKMDQAPPAMSERSFGSASYDGTASEMSEVGMSPEDIVKEKRTLLFKLKRYEKKGYKLSRQYSLHSTLEDLRSEYESIRREANLEQGLQVSKNILISTCSLMEYMNNKFDPMDIVLDGWSEEVNEDVDEGKYDEVLEELYYKYYDKVTIGPELKLLTMLGGSAVKFHMTHTLLKTMVPDAETLLKRNPNLKNDIANLMQKNGVNTAQNLNAEVNNMMFTGKVGGLGPAKKPMRPPNDVDQILRDIEKDVETQSNASSETKKRRKNNVLEMKL